MFCFLSPISLGAVYLLYSSLGGRRLALLDKQGLSRVLQMYCVIVFMNYVDFLENRIPIEFSSPRGREMPRFCLWHFYFMAKSS